MNGRAGAIRSGMSIKFCVSSAIVVSLHIPSQCASSQKSDCQMCVAIFLYIMLYISISVY